MNEYMNIVAKNLNVPGLVSDVLKGPVDAALSKLVADTSIPFDDMAKNAAYPILVQEIEQLVAKEWAKLTAPEAV